VTAVSGQNTKNSLELPAVESRFKNEDLGLYKRIRVFGKETPPPLFGSIVAKTPLVGLVSTSSYILEAGNWRSGDTQSKVNAATKDILQGEYLPFL
jgi:hypothetical protein